MFNSGKGSGAAEGNSTMTVTWAELELPLECMVSTTELITGRYAMEEGQVSAELRVGASAAFRMHHHCWCAGWHPRANPWVRLPTLTPD